MSWNIEDPCLHNLSFVFNFQVHHNIAIARYFQNGCADPKKLFEVLSNFKVCVNILLCWICWWLVTVLTWSSRCGLFTNKYWRSSWQNVIWALIYSPETTLYKIGVGMVIDRIYRNIPLKLKGVWIQIMLMKLVLAIWSQYQSNPSIHSYCSWAGY